jgi:hypothetical protein
MRKNILFLVLGTLLMLCSTTSFAQQVAEPDFIGEAVYVDDQGNPNPLEKSIASYARGISWKSNSWSALTLVIPGGEAGLRIPKGKNATIIVKASNNNSDPLSIVTVYKFDAKKKKRYTMLSKDNSGTLMKSKTNTKNQLIFRGAKYGESSYKLQFDNLQEGEYGIVVANPDNVDEKKAIVSCFGVDK